MSDKKQLQQMSQFSIIRETPGNNSNHNWTYANARKQKPSEIKFKYEEPIGVRPEDDDDLETCPARTRASWPHQIIPWWKPADRFEKPPYSYATLIAHAILTSKNGRLTLSDIYKWISEAYPYYKRGQKGWQNSIRHNLSLNRKWFVKEDRRPTQAHPGKGGYWTLRMNTEKIFVDNLSQTGGHSRRHHDMGMYASLNTRYYRSSNEDAMNTDDMSMEGMCPNIHITRPEDYEAKKNKATISAPRIRNMTAQEKKNKSASTATSAEAVASSAPKTDPKNFIIRFNPLDPVSKRRKASDPQRPPPKAGKRRNPVEPGSSTADDDDSAVDVGSYSDSHASKKRKSTTKSSQQEGIDTISASPYVLSYPEESYNNLTRPSDVIGGQSNDLFNDFWAEQPNQLLLTSEYPVLLDVEAQNILNGLQSAPAPAPPVQTISQHPDMKTIDLQSFNLEKNLHFSNTFSADSFSDPNSQWYVPDLTSYNLDQYVDFDGSMALDDVNGHPPSDLLLEDETLNTYWPETSGFNSFDNVMNFTSSYE